MAFLWCPLCELHRRPRLQARAMEKLGIDNRSALVRYALEHGWLHSS
jgi:hypothetical protein